MSVTIRRVDSVEQLKDERYDKVLVNTYNCVVDRGSFSVGDFCILITPLTSLMGNLVPEIGPINTDITVKPEYISGELSEAKVLPPNVLTKYADPTKMYNYTYRMNERTVELAKNKNPGTVGNSVYYPGICSYINEMSKKVPKDIPLYQNHGGCNSFSPYSTYELQNSVKDSRYMQRMGKPFYITPKLDGVYITYADYCGKVSASIGGYKIKVGNVYSDFIKKHGLDTKLPGEFMVSGYMMGPGIYGNPAGLKEPTFFVDVVRDDACNLIPFPDCGKIVKKLGLRFTPVEKFGNIFDLSIEELTKMASGNYPNGKPKPGILLKTYFSELLHRGQ